MDKENLKIAIIGAGPSGGILGSHLAYAGYNVTLVDVWKEHMDKIERNGLKLIGFKELTANFEKSKLILSINELKDINPDIVFIAVKTSVFKIIVKDLKSILQKNTLLVSYQNGIGTEDYLAEHFDSECVFRVVINYAGGIVGPGIINMTFFNPPNYIGSVSTKQHDTAKNIAKILTESGLETKFQESILPAEWKKGILNSSLSGLCAVTNMTMKEAMKFPYTENLVSNLIKEGIEVSKSIGIHFDDNFHDQCMDYLRKGGNHKPSMLVDILNRNPTEAEFLNLKIVEIGDQNNINVPYNKAINGLIQALDFLNGEDRQMIKVQVKEKGFDEKCLKCQYVKNCIDSFSYCPLHGHPIPPLNSSVVK